MTASPETITAEEYLRGRTAGHIIMFWMLMTLAVLVFTPCVLVPIWLETKELHQAEQQMAALVESLERQVETNERHADALAEDPLVNQRLVREQLNVVREGEEVLRWTPEELAAMKTTPSPVNVDPAPARPPWPSWVSRGTAWLPNWPWEKLFAESPQRPMLMIMAGGLLLAAFVLYSPVPLPQKTSAS